jgi:UDP-N-acetylmuramoyl-tripeptide--D-alanyl-D-alanine ligase
VRALTSAIASAVGGRQLGPDVEIRRVVFDSRAATPGSLFVALEGARTDGHRFVRDALARGAVAALVDRLEVHASMLGTLILVADPGAALLDLARWRRGSLRATSIGITGSVGKTTTKDLTRAVLASRYRTAASERSHNNELGVPVTVCAAEDDTEMLVCEIGAGARGEIAALCGIVRPSIGVVTAVGPAHLETFGSIDAIADAKAELVASLPQDGLAILNDDDPVVRGFDRRTRARVMRFGCRPDVDVRADRLALDERGRLSFHVRHRSERADARLSLIGRHQATPALAAIATGIALGVPLEEAALALVTVSPAARRLEERWTPRGVRVLDDTYNANPTSMRAALEALVAVADDAAQTFAVLGRMEQLGPTSSSAHRALGAAAARLGVDVIATVDAEEVAEGAEAAGGPVVIRTRDPAAAIEQVERATRPGDVVLLKASRASGLDLVADALVAGSGAMEPSALSGGR